jgi:hypothetical protein
MGTRLAEDRETIDYSLNDRMARRRDRATDLHQNDESDAPISVDDTERRTESE